MAISECSGKHLFYLHKLQIDIIVARFCVASDECESAEGLPPLQMADLFPQCFLVNTVTVLLSQLPAAHLMHVNPACDLIRKPLNSIRTELVNEVL